MRRQGQKRLGEMLLDLRLVEPSALAYLGRSGSQADLMLTDIKMPGADGMSLLRSVKGVRPQMPVILVSGLYELALALDALELGADDYLKKPVEPNDVVNVVQKYLRGDMKRQEEAIQSALSEYLAEGDHKPGDSAHISTVFQQLGFKRYETFQHSKRVAAYARIFGERCGLPPARLDRLELGALLHDIGKIGIPRNVLLKPGKLTDEEWEVMKTIPRSATACWPASTSSKRRPRSSTRTTSASTAAATREA